MKSTKKILTALLAVVMAFALISAAAAAAGDGSEEPSMQIATSADLFEFANRVMSGETALCADLTADITDIPEWTIIYDDDNYGTGDQKHSSIGQYASLVAESPTPYTGTFNGNGKTLKLIKTSSTSPDRYNMALFHTIGPGGVVKNLNLDVDFHGFRNLAGVAVYNYGAIEYVTVKGTIESSLTSTASSYVGGIAARNGKIAGDAATDGKIFHCINEANITGGGVIGGIVGNFISGEIRCCANTGNISGTTSFAGLVSMLSEVDAMNHIPLRVIISDCYNAGKVYNSTTAAIDSSPWGGLLGGASGTLLYQADADEKYNNIEFSNLFVYGELSVNADYNSEFRNIIGAASGEFRSYEIAEMYSNVYYREGIGTRLFHNSSLGGKDGLGTDLVKTVIHSKTAAEFASAEMAALLNKGRTGANAPWEYIEGNDYPTLKENIVPSRGEIPVDVEENIVAGVDTVTVSEQAIELAIQNAGANESATVQIEAAKGETVSAVTVQIPVTGLQAVSDDLVVQNIMIASPVGDITLDTAAVEDLIKRAGGAGGVEIVIERKDDTGLNEAQKTALKDKNTRGMGDIHIVIGKSKVDDFSTEEGTLTVGLPYTLQPGETDEDVRVVYVSDEGEAETMDAECGEGWAVFNTNHLSVYAVTYEPATVTGGDGDNGNGDGNDSDDDLRVSSGGGCDASFGIFGAFVAAGAMIFALGTASATKRRRSR